MESYDNLVAEIQELIATEETEIEVLQLHATGVAAETSVTVRSELVARLESIISVT